MTAPHRGGLAAEFLLLGVLALLWGSSYLFIKVAVTEIPPVTLIAARASIAAVFLMAVVRFRGDTLPRDGRTWRLLFIQSFFNATGAWTLLAWGQRYVDSALASVLNSTSPIFVFILTTVVFRSVRPEPLKLLGGVLGCTGVVLIVGVDALAGLGQQVAGQLAALTGALLYAFAAIYGSRFRHLSAPVTAAGTMISAAVVLVPLSLVLDAPWTLSPSPKAIAATLALSVLCTGVAMMIYFRLVHTLGSMGVASQAYLRAGVGVLLGMVFLGETVTMTVGIGLLLAVLGVAAINMPRRVPRIDP